MTSIVKFSIPGHNKCLMKRRLVFLILICLILTACASGGELRQVPTPSASATLTEVPTHTTTPLPTDTPEPSPTPSPSPTPEPEFSFVVTSDMSHYSDKEYFNYPNFFAALLGYVKQFGPGDFMVSTGDVIPAEGTSWTVHQVLGEDYPWFPLPGNHDFGTADIKFLQNYAFDFDGPGKPALVRWGPEPCSRTTYSFDYMNAHFVALNVYCNAEAPWGIDGSISDTLYDWLLVDLEATDKEHIFIFGHEPAFPQSDQKTGQARHLDDSLNQYPEARDRFWALLGEFNVLAYIHGHTHTYSAVQIDGVWQLDAGQAMGVRAAPSPGTFFVIKIKGNSAVLETYRGEDGPGFAYALWQKVQLRP